MSSSVKTRSGSLGHLDLDNNSTFTPPSSLNSISSPRTSSSSDNSEIKTLLLQLNARIQHMENEIEKNKKSGSIKTEENEDSDSDNEKSKRSSGATPHPTQKHKTHNDSTETKKNLRLLNIFKRIGEANNDKLGLSTLEQEQLSSFMKGNNNDMDSLSNLLNYDTDPDSENEMEKKSSGSSQVKSHSKSASHFVDDLIPYKVGEKQSLITTIAEMLNVKAKSIKKFDTYEALVTLFNKQLFEFVAEERGAGDKVRVWMQYYNFIMKLSHTHGLEATSEYHFKLFNKILEEKYDLVQRGYFDAEIMRIIDTKYVKLENNSKSKLRSYTNTNNSSYTNNRSYAKSGKGDKFCKKHGKNSNHTTEQCFSLNKQSQSKSDGQGSTKKQ